MTDISTLLNQVLQGDCLEVLDQIPDKSVDLICIDPPYNINKDGTLNAEDRLLRGFFKQVDKVARPCWCPRFVLRLLHLFGSDNSIIRVRNWKLHNLELRLTKGIAITDTKWKYDSFRIYGNFTAELDQLAADTCNKIENEYEKKYK